MIQAKTMTMKQQLLFFLLYGLLWGGCTSDSVKQGSQTGDVPLPTLTSNEACQTLLVIMEDRSGSTNDHRKFTEQDYQSLAGHFAREHSGTIALRAIGNVAPQDREFFRLKFPPLFDALLVPGDETLSEKGKVVRQNKRIASINDSLRQANLAKVAGLMHTIKNKIIGYRPAGKDLTDVAEALTHLNAIVNEATFKNYQNVVVVLASDGKHDASRVTLKGLFSPARPVDMYLIGWKDPAVFEGIGGVQSFESKDGFLNWWESFRCK